LFCLFFKKNSSSQKMISVTRLGEISPLGRYFLALGAFF
jgi:hypothetical protein